MTTKVNEVRITLILKGKAGIKKQSKENGSSEPSSLLLSIRPKSLRRYLCLKCLGI